MSIKDRLEYFRGYHNDAPNAPKSSGGNVPPEILDMYSKLITPRTVQTDTDTDLPILVNGGFGAIAEWLRQDGLHDGDLIAKISNWLKLYAYPRLQQEYIAPSGVYPNWATYIDNIVTSLNASVQIVTSVPDFPDLANSNGHSLSYNDSVMVQADSTRTGNPTSVYTYKGNSNTPPYNTDDFEFAFEIHVDFTYITDLITAEQTRAETAEQAIRYELTEYTDNQVSNEQHRANAREDALQGDIHDEINRATAAENAILTEIETEKIEREDADAEINNRIDGFGTPPFASQGFWSAGVDNAQSGGFPMRLPDAGMPKQIADTGKIYAEYASGAWNGVLSTGFDIGGVTPTEAWSADRIGFTVPANMSILAVLSAWIVCPYISGRDWSCQPVGAKLGKDTNNRLHYSFYDRLYSGVGSTYPSGTKLIIEFIANNYQLPKP